MKIKVFGAILVLLTLFSCATNTGTCWEGLDRIDPECPYES